MSQLAWLGMWLLCGVQFTTATVWWLDVGYDKEVDAAGSARVVLLYPLANKESMFPYDVAVIGGGILVYFSNVCPDSLDRTVYYIPASAFNDAFNRNNLKSLCHVGLSQYETIIPHLSIIARIIKGWV